MIPSNGSCFESLFSKQDPLNHSQRLSSLYVRFDCLQRHIRVSINGIITFKRHHLANDVESFPNL